jgi:DNA polymerase III sliding clamp (beta) subunit (PCNA family)
METTRQITIDRHVLTTINSMAAFCEPKNGVTDIIKGLRATRIENDRLMVVATNRYVAAKAIFDNVEFSNWEDAQMWIDAETLKSATVFAKTQHDAQMTIGYDTDTEDSFISVGDTRFTYRQNTGNYPAIEKLFGETSDVGVPMIRVNPKWFAMLTKVIEPAARPDKDMPWSLSFAVSDNPNKPGPIHANISGVGYDISVLIQPNHAIR